MDKIDELHANTVTPEKFETIWGVSLEAQMQELMEFVNEQNAKNAAAK